MDLLKVIDRANILPSSDAKNKDQVLREIAATLFENGYINETEEFVEDIYLREEQGETGIGNYIAIPHGQSDSVSETTIAIAKLNEEIEWETLDGKGVKVVILFAVQNDTEFAATHLKLLAEVAKKLANNEVSESLVKATTTEEIIYSFR